MKLLAIDASGQVASVALAENGVIIADYSVNFKKTHSQTLLPMIDEILRMTETERSSIEGIAVSKGPGSFTGLRIGGATAKGLCCALGVPVAGISTLEMLAANFLGSQELIVPLMDARRNQVYSAAYDVAGNVPRELLAEGARGIDELVDELNKICRNVVILGDGAGVYRNYVENNISCPYRFAPANLMLQSASSLAVLGMKAFEDGRVCAGSELELEYLRMSQAERERMEREQAAEAQNG